MKTRFSKFCNLPELMSMFKQIADIQTPDMLNLPVPTLKGGKTQNIRTEASEYQKQMVAALGERADAVRGGNIDPREDNMLKITNDGRLLALDARLIDPTLPDDPNSKVNTCFREVLRIYTEGMPQKLTQMIFCGLSTPERSARTAASTTCITTSGASSSGAACPKTRLPSSMTPTRRQRRTSCSPEFAAALSVS